MEPTAENKAQIDAFLQEYKALIDKHGVDFIAYPVYIPDGKGGFSTVVQQQPIVTNNGVKSPDEFVPKT